jgi:hypothetical protein
MRSKIRAFKFISDYFDTRLGTYYIKENTKELNIYFDENMYIEYPSNFEKEIHSILEEYRYLPNTEDNRFILENKINYLLDKYRNSKQLFLESDLFFQEKEGMTILSKEDLFDNY